jgi:hypothetical protein
VFLAGLLRYARFGRRHARQHIAQLARLILRSSRLQCRGRSADYFRPISRRRVGRRRRWLHHSQQVNTITILAIAGFTQPILHIFSG